MGVVAMLTHRKLESSWPVYDEEEIEAAAAVLRSGRVNALQHGDKCDEFENAFARRCEMTFAIALANGTVALELALRALGVRPGDEVIVPARSFFATASCVVAVGATPVFADVDCHSQCIDPLSIREAFTSRTRAVIAVHLAGWPCDMHEIAAICADGDVLLIEDCAQSHGATYYGRPVGSLGDAAAFSFCTDKIMSTGGEGGMLLLRNEQAYERAWSFKDHGKNRRKVVNRQGSTGAFQYLHDSFGTNWRMTEMQAAIGIVQLRKLDGWVEQRRSNAAILTAALADVEGVIVDTPPAHVRHAYYKFYARLDDRYFELPTGRDRVCGDIRARGVVCGSGSCPEIYMEEAFRSLPSVPRRHLRTAYSLGDSTLMFQCDHTLSPSLVSAIGEVAAGAVAARSLQPIAV